MTLCIVVALNSLQHLLYIMLTLMMCYVKPLFHSSCLFPKRVTPQHLLFALMFFGCIGYTFCLVQEKQRQIEQMNGGQMPDCQQVAPFQGSNTTCSHMMDVITKNGLQMFSCLCKIVQLRQENRDVEMIVVLRFSLRFCLLFIVSQLQVELYPLKVVVTRWVHPSIPTLP